MPRSEEYMKAVQGFIYCLSPEVISVSQYSVQY